MLKTTTTFSLAALATAALIGPAQAEVITNGGFDSPDFTGDSVTVDFAGWVETGALRGDENDGGRVPGSTSGSTNNQVLRLFSAGHSIYQDLGVNWTSADTYDLSFNASETWWRTAAAGDAIVVSLRQTDDTELWSSGTINLDGLHTGVAMPAWTAGQTFDFAIDASTFTAGTAGQELRLQIERDGGVSYVDNVSLTVVPEPGSLALLGLGGLLIGARRRRN